MISPLENRRGLVQQAIPARDIALAQEDFCCGAQISVAQEG
jgi:hypothetical protein